jgi:hypothetical protein
MVALSALLTRLENATSPQRRSGEAALRASL